MISYDTDSIPDSGFQNTDSYLNISNEKPTNIDPTLANDLNINLANRGLPMAK